MTTSSEEVDIVNAGEHNFHSGPDFFNAKIRVGGTLWAGNVEVHVNASDWNKHNHQHDKAYDNIILHVVNNADEKIFRSSGEEIPTIELKSRIRRKLLDNYLDFKSSNGWVSCERNISHVPGLILNSTIDKLLVERLESRSVSLLQRLRLTNNDWEECFYQLLARSFGFKINADPFELLSKSVSYHTINKHKNSLFQVEALLFGQAGLLEKHFEDKYPASLQNEYVFLKRKIGLKSLDSHLWKFLRLRPSNFPTVRIAQFASLLNNSSCLFSKILEADSIEALRNLVNVSVSEYWHTHYLFDKVSGRKNKTIGEPGIDIIIINTIIPFLFVYGRQMAEDKYSERALDFLHWIGPESNSITESWKRLGIPLENAGTSQALLQLKNEYCSKKRCLDCNVGNYVLKNS